MVPIRKLYAAVVPLLCFQRIIDHERKNIPTDRPFTNSQLASKIRDDFMPSGNQNAHNLYTTLVGCHGQSPPFLWLWLHLIGQTGQVMTSLRNFFGENEKPDEWRQWLSLSQHSSGYLVTRRIPRHGAFARYERVFSWRALRLFTLPQRGSHRFVGYRPRHRPHLEAKRRLPGTSHSHHLVTTGAF